MRLPPLGAWSWSGPGSLPGTGRGFSFDDDSQADPLSCESMPKHSPESERHTGSLEAFGVTRPKAVVLADNKQANGTVLGEGEKGTGGKGDGSLCLDSRSAWS